MSIVATTPGVSFSRSKAAIALMRGFRFPPDYEDSVESRHNLMQH